MSFVAVRALIDRDDVVHLFWGEVAGESISDTTGGTGATQLWTMKVTEQSSSEPRLLFASKLVRWDQTTSEQLVFAGDKGTLHVLIPGRRQPTEHPFVLMSLANGEWTHETVYAGRIVVPESVSGIARDGEVFVVFTSPVTGNGYAKFGSVFFSRRRASDAQWTNAELLQARIGGSAKQPVISAAPNGDVRVFWLQHIDSDDLFEVSRIRGVELDRVEAKVRQRIEFASPTNLLSIRSVWTDPCGRTNLHLVTGDVGDRSGAYTFSWDGSRWTSDGPYSHQFWFAGRSSISIGEDNVIRRLWSAVFFGPGLPVVTFWWESTRRLVVPTR
ncbi:MAG: hypothetical protein IT359_02355 [Gemmatimonadaceae bacterium]|nr:hypothetical protein [Gemmatimonadaceae bacterium]